MNLAQLAIPAVAIALPMAVFGEDVDSFLAAAGPTSSMEVVPHDLRLRTGYEDGRLDRTGKTDVRSGSQNEGMSATSLYYVFPIWKRWMRAELGADLSTGSVKHQTGSGQEFDALYTYYGFHAGFGAGCSVWETEQSLVDLEAVPFAGAGWSIYDWKRPETAALGTTPNNQGGGRYTDFGIAFRATAILGSGWQLGAEVAPFHRNGSMSYEDKSSKGKTLDYEFSDSVSGVRYSGAIGYRF